MLVSMEVSDAVVSVNRFETRHWSPRKPGSGCLATGLQVVLLWLTWIADAGTRRCRWGAGRIS